jgi:hypothetical protein
MPFAVMIACSLLILREIREKSRNFIRKKLNRATTQKAFHRNKRLFYLLAMTNAFFIITWLPLSLNSIIMNMFKTLNAYMYDFRAYFHILAFANNSFNFVFYAIFSQKYRKTCVAIFARNGAFSQPEDVCRKQGERYEMATIKDTFQTRSKNRNYSKSTLLTSEGAASYFTFRRMRKYVSTLLYFLTKNLTNVVYNYTISF